MDQALVASVNNGNQDYFDPFVSRDGLRLYVAPIASGSVQQIQLATRPAVGQNFGPAVPVAGINSGDGDSSPALSPDERILVFSSSRPGGPGATDLWYATRPSGTGSFSSPRLIPTVNGTALDSDPMLSADGCELYFASNRVGVHHLFRARVMN